MSRQIRGLPNQEPPRNRTIYLLALIIVIIIGLPTRTIPQLMPHFMVMYVGDALWALAIYLMLGILLPHANSRYLLLIALTFTWAIEFSQFYQADWINAVRRFPLAGLILGFSFLWSDLVAYTVGIFVGLLIEKALLLRL